MRQLLLYVCASLARVYLLPLYFLAGLVPRRQNLWVFGSWGGERFADNSAEFFRYCRDGRDDIESVWISHRFDIVRELQSRGYRAYWWWSPRGMLKCLRARVHLFDCFAKDTNFWLSRGATLINLWSGVPLKSFERDIDNPDNRYYRLFHGSAIERLCLSILMPWHVVKPDLIITTSQETREIVARAFDVPQRRVVTTGLPRNDALLTSATAPELPDAAAAAISAGKAVFVYLPTFRDSGSSFASVDWSQVDKALEKNNACLLIKLHPVDTTTVVPDGHNIHVLERKSDIYRLLQHSSALISDYSSIIWDYLLLRRPIVFFAPDLDEFSRSSRALNFDLKELDIGTVCHDVAQLVDAIDSLCRGQDPSASGRQALVERIHEHTDASSSARVMAAIRDYIGQARPSRPGYFAGLCYRLRYNSWPRLIVNALKRIGITILPYYLFRRRLEADAFVPDLRGLEFTELSVDNAPELAALPLVHGDENTFCERFQAGQRCFALRDGGAVVALNWMDPERCSFPAENFALAGDEAYFFDVYTNPAYRGRNLAGMLSACYSDLLYKEGIRTTFSVVDSMNESSLHYVAKLGCQTQHKNLYISLFGWFDKTLLLESHAGSDASVEHV